MPEVYIMLKEIGPNGELSIMQTATEKFRTILIFAFFLLIVLSGAYDVLLVTIILSAFILIVLNNEKYKWLREKIDSFL